MKTRCSTRYCRGERHNGCSRCQKCQRTHDAASHEVRKALAKLSKKYPALADYLSGKEINP